MKLRSRIRVGSRVLERSFILGFGLTVLIHAQMISVEINLTEFVLTMNDSSGNTQAYDLRILRALRRITRLIALHSRQLAACSNITAPQLICLRAVIDNEVPITATAISREMHVSPSTVVGILDRLEDKGLVRRERGREDRRIVFVSATEDGVALARATPSPLQKKLADALNDLPELEQATITLSLERIVGLIETNGVTEGHEEPVSPILEVPDGIVPPESGLVV
jgi:DNA-binding MarR family transcriptional regulator